ncbi:MAG: VanZ family protein [Pyrinomonadaceae bacterium]|nr:VanZ family protein [Pyrinomonadaceae bacterium]
MPVEQQNRRGRLWRYAPLIFWLCVIAYFSSGNASMSNTSRVIRPILLFLIPDLDEISILTIQVFIRKTAHFITYFTLALLASRAFATSKITFLRRFWFAFAFLIMLITASLDEFHQSYLSTRTGSAYDVSLDSIGGATAILIYFVIKKFGARDF